MFLGLFLIANFTANVTTALTLDELRGTINGLEYLTGHRVATVFKRGDYGIALPTDSPCTKLVDRALLAIKLLAIKLLAIKLLAIKEDGTYAKLYLKWFGAEWDQ